MNWSGSVSESSFHFADLSWIIFCFSFLSFHHINDLLGTSTSHSSSWASYRWKIIGQLQPTSSVACIFSYFLSNTTRRRRRSLLLLGAMLQKFWVRWKSQFCGRNKLQISLLGSFSFVMVQMKIQMQISWIEPSTKKQDNGKLLCWSEKWTLTCCVSAGHANIPATVQSSPIWSFSDKIF